MERVYLLLRNNQQTGPFTIGELLQQQLKSSDMIWIEGKSAAWTYLSELELTFFIKDPGVDENFHAPKTEDEIERKAEELRQRVLVSARKTYFPKLVTEIETYESPYKIPAEELQIVDHRKERNNKRSAVLGEFLLTCFVIGIFMFGIYRGKSFLGVKEQVQNSVATQLDSADQHAAQKNKPVSPKIILPADSITKQQDSLLLVQKSIQKAPTVRKRVIASSIEATPSNSISLDSRGGKEENQSDSQTPVTNSEKDEVLIKKELAPVIPEIKMTEPAKEEKKGFLKGLFKKKKNDNSDKVENKNG